MLYVLHFSELMEQMKKKLLRKYEKCNKASKPDSSLYVVEQENVGGKEKFTVSYCTETNPEQNRDPWLFKVILIPASILEHTDMIGVSKEKYNC